MLQSAAFRILACFYDNDTYTFVELCKRSKYPNDLGGYYIRQLLSGGYLERADRGVYRILPEGKRQLAFHYGKHMLAPRPRLNVVVIAQKGESFVIMRRRVQPFIGFAEWPAGMVHMGETLAAAAKRITHERLGLEVSPDLVGMFRRIDMYQESTFDDKVFAVHTCTLDADCVLSEGSVTGDNLLCSSEELGGLKHASQALMDMFEYVRAGRGQYEERMYQLSEAELSLGEKSRDPT